MSSHEQSRGRLLHLRRNSVKVTDTQSLRQHEIQFSEIDRISIDRSKRIAWFQIIGRPHCGTGKREDRAGCDER